MLSPLEGFGELCAVLGVIGVNFVLLPMIFLWDQRDLGLTERCWTAGVIGTAFWMFVTTVLAAFHILDAGSMVCACLFAVMAYARIRSGVPFRMLISRWLRALLVHTFFYLERSGELRVGSRAGERLIQWLKGLCNVRTVMAAMVLGYSSYLRLYYAVYHPAYGLFDPYVHLVFMKHFFHGDLFFLGMYPRGEHAVLCAIGGVSAIDSNTVVRFAGGIVGALTPAALYFLLLQSRLQWTSALFATAFFGICDPFGILRMVERQTATFPQEFALVFALVGLAFAIRYLRLGVARDRWMFAVCSVVTWSSHTLIGLVLYIAGAALVVDYLWCRSEQKPERLKLLLREAVGGVAGGNLYLIIGSLMGQHPFEESLHYVLGNSASGSDGSLSVGQVVLQQVHWANVILLAAAALLVIFSLCHRTRFPSPGLSGLWSLVMFGLLLAKLVLHLSVPLPPDRLVVLLPVFTTMVAGWLYELLVETAIPMSQDKIDIRPLIATFAITAAAIQIPLHVPMPPSPQHDEGAALYEYASTHYHPGSWMIVGQNEEYELCLDSAIHMTVKKLVSDYNASTPDDTPFDVPLVFIIHEKKPPLAWKGTENSRESEEQRLGIWLQIYALHNTNLRMLKDTPNATLYLIDCSQSYHPPSQAKSQVVD